ILAVKATNYTSSANVTIQVSVDGPATGPTLHLQSPDNPQLGETDLLTVLATGHLPDQPGQTKTTSQQAASLVGGLVAGQLQKTLQHRLPLDVLTIDAGQGLSGSRLEA